MSRAIEKTGDSECGLPDMVKGDTIETKSKGGGQLRTGPLDFNIYGASVRDALDNLSDFLINYGYEIPERWGNV